MKKQAIIHDSDRLALYRERLGDLSWYMRRLNEPLAKLSNGEENCTGRFWEGRYSSQALLDEAAVFSCMAYVDLNPVRARITEKLEESENTSIKQRINEIQTENTETELKQAVDSVAGKVRAHSLPINLKEYMELVEWTGKTIIHPNKASIPPHVISVLERLNLQQGHWLKHIEDYGKHYCRVVGPINKIREKAKRIKVRCLQGISAAKLMYTTSG